MLQSLLLLALAPTSFGGNFATQQGYAAPRPARNAQRQSAEATSGPATRIPRGNRVSGPARVGRWEASLNWPVKAIHAALLPTGHILSHASDDPTQAGSTNPSDPHDTTRVDLADIATWSHEWIDHPTEELYGASHALLEDGGLLEFGGNGGRTAGLLAFGQDQCTKFDAGLQVWLPMDDMHQARWSPSALTLGSGHTLSIGGSHAGGNSFLPEVFDGTSWRTLDGASYQNRLSNGDNQSDHTYPFVHLASDGRVFWAGWDEEMAFLDPRGNGAWSVDFMRENIQRTWGTSVMYAVDRVLIAGGVDHQGNFGSAESSALTIDISSGTPQVSATSPLRFARADANATILADGSVIVNGGNGSHSAGANPSAIFVPEIWNPATGNWRRGAPATKRRGYHSTALLLPDARLWTGGGECGSGCSDGLTAEVYSPPYLFTRSGALATRPVINGTFATIRYGQNFTANVTAPEGVAKVTFIRLGSVTHGVNSEQRYLELSFTQNGNTLTLTPPGDGNQAPPGHYMLFVIDGAGVPSEAAFVRLTAPTPVNWQFVSTSNGSSPTARHEAAFVELGGEFYLMGGRGSRPVQRFDPATATWTNLGNPPLQMHHFQPVVFDDEIWAVGAFVGNYPNETPVANIHRYDATLNSWSLGAAMPAGRNRGAAGAVVYDGKIYLVCGNTMGHNGGFVPWLDEFDPVSQTWTPLPDAPNARDHFLASVIGHKLYVAGGRQTDQPNPFDATVAAVDVYDFSTGVWSTLSNDLPTERAGTMSVTHREHLIVIGGESDGQNAAHNEVEALDTLTGRWSALPNLIQGRHSGGAVSHRGRLFVASGSGNKGGSPELNTTERLWILGQIGSGSVNLVADPGFDEGLAGWTALGDLALRPGGSIQSPSLEVQNGSAERTIAAAPQTAYSFGGSYKMSGSAGTPAIGMDYLDGGGVEIGEDFVALTNKGVWSDFEVSGTTPAGTASIRLWVFANASRVLTVDDLVLVQGSLPIAPSSGATRAAELRGGDRHDATQQESE